MESGSLVPARSDRPLVDWYLVFEDGVGAPGWRRWLWGRAFTSPGFRHVWCLRFDGERWLAVNSKAAFMEVAVLPDDWKANVPRGLVNQGKRVVWCQARLDDRVYLRRGLRGQLTCVTLAKHLLQVQDAWVLTPYRLYCWAVKHGVEVKGSWSE